MSHILFIALFVMSFQAKALFVDEWKLWSPLGKQFDIMCFKAGDFDPDFIKKNVTMVKYNRINFTVKDEAGKSFSMDGSSCFLEQREAASVARKELMGEIYNIRCAFGDLPFESEDLRLLGKNNYFTSVKRLSDGKVYMAPSKECHLKRVLEKMEPIIVKVPVKVPVKTDDKDQGELKKLREKIESLESEIKKANAVNYAEPPPAVEYVDSP